MSCRKCKNLINEFKETRLADDLAYYVFHLRETHGVAMSDLKDRFPEANWEMMLDLEREQRVTGQAGSEDVFGHKATREIKRAKEF